MNKFTRLTIVCTLLLLGLLITTGCDVFDDSRFDTITVPPETLHKIDTIDLDNLSRKETPEEPNVAAAENQSPPELDLTIEQCRSWALENNLDMKVQLYNPQMAREDVIAARAAFEPLLFSQFNFTKTDQPTYGSDPLNPNRFILGALKDESINADTGITLPLRTGGSITIDQPFNWYKTNRYDYTYTKLNTSYTSDLVLSISQPLLRGAGVKTNTSAIRIARYNTNISEALTRLEIIRVLADVDRMYWRLYAYRKELEVRKQEYDLAQDQLDQAKRLVKAGQSANIEIIRAQAALAERAEAVIVAENEVRHRQRELLFILNRPDLAPESLAIIRCATGPNIMHYKIDQKKILDYAMDHRMELLQLELQLAIDADRIDFERNGTLPYLVVDYTYNVNGLGPTAKYSYDLLARNRFADQRLRLQLQIPLGNQKAMSALRRAILEKEQRLATKQLRKNAITQKTLAVIDQLEANWLRVQATQTSALLAGQQLEAEQRNFQQGLQTSINVLDAQTKFTDAQSAHIQAVAEYQIAQVDLAYAAGALIGAAQIHWDDQKNTLDMTSAAPTQTTAP